MEIFKSKDKKNIENLMSIKSNEEIINEERIGKYSKDLYNNKRKYRHKEKILIDKPKTSQTSKERNIYTKRTYLIDERKNLLDIKNIKNEKEEIRNSVKLSNENNIINSIILTDIGKEDKNKENNIMFKSLKEDVELNDKKYKNNLSIKNIFLDNKYIKKIPIKNNVSTSVQKPKVFKKYQTSTLFYKKRSTGNNSLNKEKEKEKYNFNTFNLQKELENSDRENKINNEMEFVGYNTGFIYKNKIIEKLDLKELKNNSPKNLKITTYEKSDYKRNTYKNSNNLLDKNQTNNIKNDFNENTESYREKNLNSIYIPKKINHLSRGSSQKNYHNLKKTIPNPNNILKNRNKSYKTINNFLNKDNNNINININNNIKIITYNKKKSSWKMDKDEIIIEQEDNKIDDEKFDLFKDNISDISSIESKSNIESETTENNNKLNVYLNNIYKTKAVFHPKLFKKKENVTNVNSGEGSMKNTLPIPKENINDNKRIRNESVPHYVFRKEATKEKSGYINKNNLKNYKDKSESNNIKNIKIINKNNENEPNFEELVILGEKLKIIIEGIDKNSSIIDNYCFDFLNYFHESSFISIIEKLFDNKNLKIINISLKYLLFSVIVLYNYCADSYIEENDCFLYQEVFSLNLQNILHLYEYIISKIKSKNPWALIIKNIIHIYKRSKKKVYSSNTNLNYQSVFDKIKNNTKFIRQIINRIFSNNRKINNRIISFSKELEKKSFIDFKNFFKKNIYIQNTAYGYIFPFSLYKNNSNRELMQEKPNFIKKQNYKKYTLLLGLEEILINLELDNKYESKGTLKLRPGLISFLKEMHYYYEIIIFSLSEEKITNYLLNSIEKRNKFIDYRLYRENFSIINDEFVLDLKEIGRPLEKIIIISNIPQIYQLYKENSINIKSYWEENLNDNILTNLMIILKNIVREGGDVRDLLLEFKDDIIKYVTIGSSQP